MAENLRFHSMSSMEGTYIDTENDSYGCLYSYLSALYSCPNGWHLPQDKEWMQMEFNAGLEIDQLMNLGYRDSGNVGLALKSGNLWKNDGNGTGNESFNVTPAGYAWENNKLTESATGAYFWTSSKTLSGVLIRHFRYNSQGIVRGRVSKNLRLSVRCIKDGSNIESEAFYGTLKDPRDGQNYRTIEIGKQTWMADNLNYDSGEVCWKYDQPLLADRAYGRFYNWANAMNIDQKFNFISFKNEEKNFQGICPDGWHLPSDNDWKDLEKYIAFDLDIDNSMVADNWIGSALKAKYDWKNQKQNCGQSGFCVLPVGSASSKGITNYYGLSATFWTSTETTAKGAWNRSLFHYNESITRVSGKSKTRGYSIRCLKN